ncbi:STAS domain-containing protein [Mycolicibacterium neoaurum]|uniref:STAS domain-containing protein n=1 Tax=Mycolicibacterium neoaurum TaxID=1795 RepID=UPI0002DE39B7|nr:STAS domain-containing protein [Mycolicibacterium neoaurum]
MKSGHPAFWLSVDLSKHRLSFIRRRHHGAQRRTRPGLRTPSAEWSQTTRLTNADFEPGTQNLFDAEAGGGQGPETAMSYDVEQLQPRGISVETATAGNGLVIRVAGVVDMLTAQILVERLDLALATAPSTLIVDLTEVEFFAAAGIAAVVHAHRIAGHACGLAVVADSYVVLRPITLSNADQEVNLCASMRDAFMLLDITVD